MHKKIKPTLLLVSGAPASGKTTLAKELSKRFSIPLITKDSIKEILFDNLGWSNREWSKKIGKASIAVLYYVMEAKLIASNSLIVESNFSPKLDSKKFAKLRDIYDFKLIEIHCNAPGSILFERFKKRAKSRTRHQGHRDVTNIEEFRHKLLYHKYPAMNVGDKTLEIDTTDFSKINYVSIFDQLLAFASETGCLLQS